MNINDRRGETDAEKAFRQGTNGDKGRVEEADADRNAGGGGRDDRGDGESGAEDAPRTTGQRGSVKDFLKMARADYNIALIVRCPKCKTQTGIENPDMIMSAMKGAIMSMLTPCCEEEISIGPKGFRTQDKKKLAQMMAQRESRIQTASADALKNIKGPRDV